MKTLAVYVLCIYGTSAETPRLIYLYPYNLTVYCYDNVYIYVCICIALHVIHVIHVHNHDDTSLNSLSDLVVLMAAKVC